MTAEHTPRTGSTWETTVARNEVVVPDYPYGCHYCGLPWDGHGSRYHNRVGLHSWQAPAPDRSLPVPRNTIDHGNQSEPRPNRATRRALKRQQRKASR